jgi:hypothetical protein
MHYDGFLQDVGSASGSRRLMLLLLLLLLPLLQVCYHCLKVLPTPQQQAAGAAELPISSRSHMFCSSSCLSNARASYYTLESQLSLEQLERHCEAYGEVRHDVMTNMQQYCVLVYALCFKQAAQAGDTHTFQGTSKGQLSAAA